MIRPLVSICIPTYNSAHFLRQAIESVLSQGFADLELVVVDDASTDDTPGLCSSFNDPRFRCVRFEANGGQAANFNRCLQEAKGELLTLLHADDYFLPGFIEDRVGRLRANADVSFVFGAVQVIDANGKALSVSRRWQDDRRLSSRDALAGLLDACIVCPPSLMARRSAVERAGAFRADLTWGHDWDWSIRLAETGAALFHATPLAAYRVHDGSGTADMLRAARNGGQERRILDEAFSRLEGNDPSFRELRQASLRSLSRRHMHYAEIALLEGRPQVTRYNLRYAASADLSMAGRPTFWALWLGSLVGAGTYQAMRRVRAKARSAA